MVAPLVLVGAAVSTEALVSLAAAAGLTAWTATPEGRKQLGKAINDTSKAINDAFATQSTGAAQICAHTKEAVREDTASRAHDDPCKPQRDAEKRALKLSNEKSDAVNKFMRAAKANDGVHPDFMPPPGSSPNPRQTRETAEWQMRRQNEEFDRLRQESKKAGDALRSATAALEACEAEQKKKKEQREKERAEKEAAEKRQKAAERRRRAEEKFDDEAHVFRKDANGDFRYQVGNEWLTREQAIQRYIKDMK